MSEEGGTDGDAVHAIAVANGTVHPMNELTQSPW